MAILTAKIFSRTHPKVKLLTHSNINNGITLAAKTFAAILLAVLMVSLGCTKKPEAEGYRVVSHDAATHQWIILRTGKFGGKYLTRRITVICSFSQWGDHEAITGPDACNLPVGQMMMTQADRFFPPAGKRDEYLIDTYVDELPDDVLSITEGKGADRVIQQFKILKDEVLPDNATQR
jgi:hypothetical protein